MTAPQTRQQAQVRSPQLTRAAARRLTDEIKVGVEATWQKLSEAYEGRAWAALGYPTWSAYVHAEVGIGRSRSYQLLNQAVVVREIAQAAGVHDVDITEAVARDLKPRLAEVTDQVRDAVADVADEDSRSAVAADVVRDAREQFLADRQTGEVLSPADWEAGTAPPEPEPPAAAAPPDGDGWSPSDAIDHPTSRSRSAGARPLPTASSRPMGIEQLFADAAGELRKAVDRVERLSADPRFSPAAAKLSDKHSGGIAYAMEGLNLVKIRLRPPAPASAPDVPPLPADRRQGRDPGGAQP